MVKVGDSIPSVPVTISKPDNKVDLSQELASGKGVIIGVPAAFSPTCSNSHVPGWVASHKTGSAGKVYVLSVNDIFVVNAWAKSFEKDNTSKITFVADAGGDFTGALDLLFDASGLLGNKRAKRFVVTTEDGKVTGVHVEPDPSKVTVTDVEKVLGS
ncbi:MAG: hypothetical protein GOMPHAMPRED_008131 [Gomphillus americanus]|uniref:Thioredoxin domain-containing protein n=1 Tax=Gomphillus americanus TaxID=1940652 RepID=A0A8H3EZ75_9LECA|nr:MAG: hypothetical protein GOMPHAMPRED_008131 [Gomphillus americanus]